MNGIFRSIPRGFSMNQYLGFDFSIIEMVFFASSIASLALSVFGDPSRFQLRPMTATENPWHGGEAQSMSQGKSLFFAFLISMTRSGSRYLSESTVNVECFVFSITFENDFVPENSSIVFILAIEINRIINIYLKRPLPNMNLKANDIESESFIGFHQQNSSQAE
jgi:hypothetical protein